MSVSNLTYRAVLEMIKARVQAHKHPLLTDLFIISQINYLIPLLSELLGVKDSEDYLTSYPVDIAHPTTMDKTTLFNISSIVSNIDRIKGLESSTLLFAKYIPNVEDFVNYLNDSFFANSFLFTRIGDKIRCFKNNDTSFGTLYLYYYRNPVISYTLTDFVDVKNVNSLIDMVIVKILPLVKEPIPQELMSVYNLLDKTKNNTIEEKPKYIKENLG